MTTQQINALATLREQQERGFTTVTRGGLQLISTGVNTTLLHGLRQKVLIRCANVYLGGHTTTDLRVVRVTDNVPLHVNEAKRVLAKAANVQTGADLAGQCEGEQIAELIDIAIALAKSDAHENVGDSNTLGARAHRIVNEIKSRA